MTGENAYRPTHEPAATPPLAQTIALISNRHETCIEPERLVAALSASLSVADETEEEHSSASGSDAEVAFAAPAAIAAVGDSNDALTDVSSMETERGVSPEPLAPAVGPAGDDLPIPVPRTWRDHNAVETEPRFSPIVSGAAVGLGLGLVLTAGVFLASGGLEGARNAADPGPRPTLASELVTASTSTLAGSPRLVLPTPPASLLADVLLVAEQLIAAGEVAAARELLGRAAAEGSAEATYALAETFDPLVLAAWGVRDTEADAEVARRLYATALAAGHERSRQRIEALE